ncbi:(2Fe-2S) ferredoxin domain-containing protein [Pseudomonas sp. TE50-2]|uniref:(2Fe-2S) ferredoxin domain-containing protein n=1 Tax=Pseudomonas sp. TE50-2 TaxID=3142707 RepID=UPI003466644E
MSMDYQRVLFVGPGLGGGSAAEAFGAEIRDLRGQEAGRDIVDTLEGFDGLWAVIREALDQGVERLLVVDLEPTSDSAYLDWLRDELGRLAQARAGVWVTAQALGRRGLDARVACASIGEPARHLACDQVNAVASDPDWSRVPEHARQVFLCTGPRCVRRGALPLWKRLRRLLLERDLIETPGGVLLTRTGCQFPCNLGPVLTVHPDGCWYRVRDDREVEELVETHLEGARIAEGLLIKGGACDA